MSNQQCTRNQHNSPIIIHSLRMRKMISKHMGSALCMHGVYGSWEWPLKCMFKIVTASFIVCLLGVVNC